MGLGLKKFAALGALDSTWLGVRHAHFSSTAVALREYVSQVTRYVNDDALVARKPS